MWPWAQAPSTVLPWLAGVSAPGTVNGSVALLGGGKARSRMSRADWMSPAFAALPGSSGSPAPL